MKRAKTFFLSILKFLIVALSLINLIALFIFDYKIPGVVTALSSEFHSEDTTHKPITEEKKYAIQLDSDTLSYNGSGTLDLLEGVSLIAPNEQLSKADIFVHIKTGSSISQKTVEYTVDTEQGQIKATRALKLSNYNGPTLKLPEMLPEISEEQLDSIVSLMPDDGSFYADDGYGKDISTAVIAKYTVDKQDPSIIHYTFTITNSFNDTISTSADLVIERTRPVIILNASSVTLSEAATFNPLEYVLLAQDTHGNSLIQDIEIEGTVDTKTAGEYTLTYLVTSKDGNTSLPQELKVVVQPK